MKLNLKKIGLYILSLFVFLILFVFGQWLSNDIIETNAFSFAAILVGSAALAAVIIPFPYSIAGIAVVPLILIILWLTTGASEPFDRVMLFAVGGVAGIFMRKKKMLPSALFICLSFIAAWIFQWRLTLVPECDYYDNRIVQVNEVVQTALNGVGRSLKFHTDTVYLVNFTKYYCIPCKKKKPVIDDLRKRFRNAPFRLITVHCFESHDIFRQKYAYDLNAYHDEQDKLSKLFKVDGLPTEIIIGPSGTECCKIEGYNSEQHDNYLENRTTVIRKQLNLIRKK